MRLLSSIRGRLTLWYVLILGVILVGFSVAVYLLVWTSQLHELDTALRATADVLEVRTQGRGSGLELVMPPDHELPLHSTVYYRLVGSSGEVLAQSDDLPQPVSNAMAPVQQDPSQSAPRITTMALGNGPSLRILSRPLHPAPGAADADGTLQVATSLAPLEASLSRLRFWLIVVVPVTLLVTSVGGVFVANRLLSPISSMVAEAQHISTERLHRRLPVQNPDDELGQLAETLNDLFDRLERAFKQQQRFIADASHELRTPLASMRAEIEIARRQSRTNEAYRELLDSLLEETEHLANMVEHLLMLAQSDAGELTVHGAEFDLGTLCLRAYERLVPLAKQRGVSLSMQNAERVPVRGDADLLEHVLFILVDNSIKFTGEDGHVEIAYGSEATGAFVEVRDNGPGIPAEHQSHLFERFYRVDSSRSRHAVGSGAGLGLSIAQSIVDAHGGTIEIDSAPGQGSTFRFHLPLSKATEINSA